MAHSEVIYSGKDNSIDLALMEDKVPVTAAGKTRWTLNAMPKDGSGATLLDSDVNPAYFATESREVAGKTIDIVRVKIGTAGLSIGNYTGELTAYDVVNTNGLVYGEFPFVVK